MTEKQKQRAPAGEELRAEHRRLLVEALQQPGVADVIKVYGQLAPYAPQPVAVKARTRYATGGNG